MEKKREELNYNPMWNGGNQTVILSYSFENLLWTLLETGIYHKLKLN